MRRVDEYGRANGMERRTAALPVGPVHRLCLALCLFPCSAHRLLDRLEDIACLLGARERLLPEELELGMERFELVYRWYGVGLAFEERVRG